MGVTTKKLSQYGSQYKISEHFTLGEFACKDGSDAVKYSTDLLSMLEKLRSYGGFTITINSGYRTASYNKKIGGASKSSHIDGVAVDVVVKRDGKVVNSKLICCLAQTLGFKGIGYISSNAVHLDMRASGSYRGDERGGYAGNVGGDFYKYFSITPKQVTDLKVTVPKPVEPKKEDDEMRYKDLSEVPEWGKASVKLRMEIAEFSGEDITESMLRCWVIEDRENPYYSNIEDVPAYWRDSVAEMVKDGDIKGDGIHEVGLRRRDIKTLIISKRMIDRLESK